MVDSSPPTRPISVREDCWSEEATSTLVDAWGRRYIELSRGNLRQKDWQEVADFVNARHGHSKKTFRTDVQCKNRVDTVKKKYKTEKARVSASNGVFVSNWPFYDRLDALVGPNVKKLASSGGSDGGQVGMSMSPQMALPVYRKSGNNVPPMSTVTPVMLPKKRPAQNDGSYFRRNYSAVAAAAAAASVEVDEGDQEEEDEEEERSRSSEERDEKLDGDDDGIKKLARAIQRFGEIYEKVEGEKQKHVMELEKQRMQFAKELEMQRMQMFMNTQVQLEKIKRSKGSGSNDIYS